MLLRIEILFIRQERDPVICLIGLFQSNVELVGKICSGFGLKGFPDKGARRST